MTSDDFDRAVAVTMRFEGGYVNDPVDPGGETNHGISKRAYPDLDIKGLTKDAARAIYRRDYWDKHGCGRHAWKLSLYHFDACVNHGAARARKFLALSRGVPGAYLVEREAFYDRLIAAKPALGKYRRGWQNRVDELRKVA
jgi:lysozyme family protein